MYNPGAEISSIAFDKIIGGALNAVVDAQNNSSISSVNFIKNVGFQTDDEGNLIKPIYVDFKYPKEISPYQPPTQSSARIKIEQGGSGYVVEEMSDIIDLGDAKLKVGYTLDSDGAIASVQILEGENKVTQDASATITAKDGATLSGTGAQLKVVFIQGKEMQKAEYQDMNLQVPILTMLPVPFIRIESTDIELNVKINSIATTTDSTSTKMDAGLKASVGYKGFGVTANVELNASISHQKQNSSSEEIKKEYSLNIKIHAVQDDMPAGLSRILDILEDSIVTKIAS